MGDNLPVKGSLERSNGVAIISDELTEKFEKYLRLGVFPETAAGLVGISVASLARWLRRGSLVQVDRENALAEDLFATFDDDDDDAVYLRFYLKMVDAVNKSELMGVTLLNKAAMGGAVISRQTVIHPDGTETVSEKFTKPDVGAIQWMLERRHKSRWGKLIEVRTTNGDIVDNAGEVAAEDGEEETGGVTQVSQKLITNMRRVAAAKRKSDKESTIVDAEFEETGDKK